MTGTSPREDTERAHGDVWLQTRTARRMTACAAALSPHRQNSLLIGNVITACIAFEHRPRTGDTDLRNLSIPPLFELGVQMDANTSTLGRDRAPL